MSQEVFVVTLRYSPLVHLVSFAYLKEGAFFFCAGRFKAVEIFRFKREIRIDIEKVLNRCLVHIHTNYSSYLFS